MIFLLRHDNDSICCEINEGIQAGHEVILVESRTGKIVFLWEVDFSWKWMEIEIGLMGVQNAMNFY